MASKLFLYALQEILQGDIDLDADDIRVALIMTGHSLITDADDGTVQTVSGITTLNESDDTGTYARQQLTEAVALDDANNRVEFSGGASTVFGSGNTMNGDGSNDYDGALLYKHVTNDGDSIPIAWVEFGSDIPQTATQVTINWNSEGIIQFAGP
jgi:hypothetical protein